MLVWPMRVMGQRVGTLQQAAAAARRVVEVLRAAPTVVEEPGAQSAELTGHVRFDDVRFGYDEERPVLDGLTLEIAPGRRSRSSAARARGRARSPRCSRASTTSTPAPSPSTASTCASCSLADLRRAVGVVFSETFLFTDTVRANIAYARPDASAADVERAARLAGAHEFVQRLPNGYDTLLGERGYSLSGGQRQRLAIARAILADPAVLILDDATSAVDATKEHEIRVRARARSCAAGRRS